MTNQAALLHLRVGVAQLFLCALHLFVWYLLRGALLFAVATIHAAIAKNYLMVVMFCLLLKYSNIDLIFVWRAMFFL
jgi:hypothetical protein